MKDLICIMCPKGCHLKVDEEHGYTVTGNRCPRGAEYGHNELKNPTRVITSTVRLRSKSACRLPVKTDGQIPKYMMEEAMRLLDKVEVTAPVHVGDVVVSSETAYHDVDATAFGYEYGQLPQKTPRFKASQQWGSALMTAGEKTGLNVKRGLIVSGDQFVASQAAIAKIKQHFPDALSAEMEGAAVAQTCLDYAIPFAAMRTISDRADDSAHVDFSEFVRTVASRYAQQVMTGLLAQLATKSVR